MQIFVTFILLNIYVPRRVNKIRMSFLTKKKKEKKDKDEFSSTSKPLPFSFQARLWKVGSFPLIN